MAERCPLAIDPEPGVKLTDAIRFGKWNSVVRAFETLDPQLEPVV